MPVTTEQRGNATLYRGLTDPEYRAMPGLNQSALKEFAADPMAYHLRRTGVVQPPAANDGMKFGSAFEALLFDGQLPGVVIPADVLNAQGHRKGAAWIAWQEQARAEYGPDMPLYTQAEYDTMVMPMLLASDHLRAHEKASRLLEGERKLVVTWNDEQTGLLCKGQIDCHCTDVDVLVDLKTARENDPEEFGRSVLNYGYHIQAWWYREAWRQATGELRPFVFVVVRNQPGYTTETIDLADEWYTLAETTLRTTLERYVRATETGDWNRHTHGTITRIAPPTWAFKALDE